MGFHESRFPLSISYGSSGGPGYSTSVIEGDAGQTEAVARWSAPRYKFDVALGIRNRDDMASLLAFYHARNGVGNGFRFVDHLDYTTAANGRDDPTALDYIIGIGDGVTTQFQLLKVYTEGAESRTRNITKPIVGTLGAPYSQTYAVLIGLAGVPTAAGWSVNVTDGIVTFSVAPAIGVTITAGCAFDVPVEFGAELDEALSASHDDFDAISADAIILQEKKGSIPVYEELNYGGSINHGVITADRTINTLEGRLHLWVDSTGVNIRLPAESITPTGTPIFYLVNGGASTTTIRDATGVSILGTIPAGSMATVSLAVDNVGAKVYIVG